MPGTSLHLDADTVNAILKAFADQPGGPTFTFQDGRIIVRTTTGTNISLVVDRIQVNAQGVDVNVSVAINR